MHARDGDTPTALGKYLLGGALAEGGISTVYLARLFGPMGFSRLVAVKRLHPEFCRENDFVAMLVDEARLAGRIHHPNVVGMLDLVQTANDVSLVVEYVHGDSLSRVIRDLSMRGARIPLTIAVAIACDVLSGLHAAHEADNGAGEALGLIHRDVTPHNIMLGADGFARVFDFGIAKAAGRLQTTHKGQIKGKLSYLAPEQLGEGEPSRQTDVYAASVVLWELVTARRLFPTQSGQSVLTQILNPTIPPLLDLVSDVPKALDDAIRRGLAKSPGERFATASAMREALETALTPARPSAVSEWVCRERAESLQTRSAMIHDLYSLDPAELARVRRTSMHVEDEYTEPVERKRSRT